MFNVEEEKNKVMEKLESGTSEEQAKAVFEYMDNIAKKLAADYESIKDTNDENILRERGYRVLTSKETKAYEKIIDKMRTQEALNGDEDIILPKTTINTVFDELVKEHQIFSEIDFQNTNGLTEIISRNNSSTGAWWGKLCDNIKKELEESFNKETVNINKLSAFLPVCKEYLDLGVVWLDRFIITVLKESILLGAEKAIFTGTGKDEPIGMNRNLKGSVVEGVYPEKTKVVLNSFEPDILFPMIGELAKTDKGSRKVSKVLFVCNPVDYWKKVLPAITKVNADGNYVQTLPFPFVIVQSEFVEVNSAIMGIGKQYFFGVGGNKEGKILYSDDFKFLDDERTYLAKLDGNGKPKDNYSFLYLDITNMGCTEDMKPIDERLSIETGEVLGKQPTELITNGHIFPDGSVIGDFVKVDNFEQYSGVKKEQSGYYFPIKLLNTGKLMTIKKNNKVVKSDVDFDPSIVMRVTKTDKFEIIVDGLTIAKFNFEYATFGE